MCRQSLIATLTRQEEDPEAIKRAKTAYRSSYRLLHDGQYPVGRGYLETTTAKRTVCSAPGPLALR